MRDVMAFMSSLDPQRVAAAAAVVGIYIVFCALLVLRRQARSKASRKNSAPSHAPHTALVAYASQTGYAEELARATHTALADGGVAAELRSIADIDAETLAKAQLAFFVVATTGEGDPPDAAARFVRTVMPASVPLGSLHYAVLALGDRTFTRYCAFGELLDGWLAARGGRRLFSAICVDNGAASALADWWRQLSTVSGAPAVPAAPRESRLQPWKLAERALANAGSAGQPAYYVQLRPTGPLPDWQAGDVALVRPQNDPAAVARLLSRLDLDASLELDGPAGRLPLEAHLRRSILPGTDAEIAALAKLSPALLAASLQPLAPREFSIASLPADGGVDLLVRQARRPDGELGLASGWLTAHAPIGSDIEVGVRANAAFRPPPTDAPMILIGNGSGLAGLRAHLKARAAAGARGNWLIFGERTSACDLFYRAEIEAWRAAGVLARADFAWSREAGPYRYVQDCVAAQAEEIRAWVDEGAAIFVCGSLRGMSEGVDAALQEAVGAERLGDLREARRYCRDVY